MTGTTNYCIQCGSRRAQGEVFCVQCGSRFPDVGLEPEVDGGGNTHNCPDCGGRVSYRAPACPHCGCPNEAWAAKSSFRDEAGRPRTGGTVIHADAAIHAGPASKTEPAMGNAPVTQWARFQSRAIWTWVGVAAAALVILTFIANRVMGLTVISGQKAAVVVASQLGPGFTVHCPTRVMRVDGSFVCTVMRSSTREPAGTAVVVVASPSGTLHVARTSVGSG